MNDEMKKDDEILRECGLLEGERKIDGMVLRPITGASFMWILNKEVFSSENNKVEQIAQFLFLHCAPISEILDVVYGNSNFKKEVIKWICGTSLNEHHSRILAFEPIVDEAWAKYSAAKTIAQFSHQETNTEKK
jgi:hypothetical protein